MFGAKAAVKGAAFVGSDAIGLGEASGLAEFMAIIIGDVGADEILDQAMLGTAFTKVNAALACDNLGVHQSPAMRAEATRGAEVDVIAELHDWSSFWGIVIPTMAEETGCRQDESAKTTLFAMGIV
jgi:hypothetical protein